MKVFDILKKVGGGIVKQMFPAAGAVIDAVNMILPEDKKLADDATGEQVEAAIEGLTPEQRHAILSKKIDVDLAEIKSFVDIQSINAEADKAGASTRPKVALIMAWTTAYGIVMAINLWCVAVWKNTITIENSWPLILAILGTPTTLLLQYFGKRTKEKVARYETATGKTTGFASLLGMFKK